MRGERLRHMAEVVGQLPKVGPALKDGILDLTLLVAPTEQQQRQLTILDRWADSRIDEIYLNDRISNVAFQRLMDAHHEAYRRQWDAIRDGKSDLGEQILG